ncbi:ABC transporter substrate-binding protein [Streptomyces radicis]|uniref:Extracellular solute-binding protein n=1 Tax=Streptomyces radicis TaxID=1750517 RepID=A0A3A9WNB4_9ACTN|nr:extracellular solute-binding protein [Streptomyces radicis]RKN10954.1 extracellular solute-binding protein [Streptomyces radicis]RKN25217.1 extracellular solute-binding protein [Streptomyces radicis]
MRTTHRRRLSATLASATATTLALAGCGSAEPVASTGRADGSITYSFWGNPARAEKVGTVIDLFAAAHPDADVSVEVAEYLNYIERMTVRAAGGGLSCAIGMQSTFYTRYAEQDVLRPLDDLIESGEIDVSQIPDEVLEAGRVDGTQYMIPTGTFARLLGYNVDLVAESGAPPPTDDMTWDAYADWLREVQAGLPEGVHATEIEAPNMFSFTSWVIGHGEEMFDEGGLAFDQELLEEWFRFWLDLTDEGVTVPVDMLAEQNAALELTPLAQGAAAVGTRDIPQLHITEQALDGAGRGSEIAEVSIPSPDPGRSANVLGTNGISIPTGCDQVGTAAAFIDFFVNDTEAALAFQSDNGILTNTRAQEALVDDADTPDSVRRNVTTLRELTDSGDLTTTTYPSGLTTLTTELSRLYQEAAFGQTSVEDAASAFFTAAERALD